jgi:16S rRNA (cytidine1402-2'-O)-methyltransferase
MDGAGSSQKYGRIGMAGNLYVVSTPIGNLGDITFRAREILQQVGLIAAEDTRRTRKLLAYFSIRTRLLSYNEHSPDSRITQLLGMLEVMDIALVSDAGSPLISDPGVDLVREAANLNFHVVSIPGPSAVIAALSIAGMPADRFQFVGFPPRRRKERVELFRSLLYLPYTLVLFEAPHRFQRCLGDLIEVLGDRNICVCREMTKMHEEVFRGTVSQAMERFVAPRGEFVIVVAGGVRASEASIGRVAVDQILQRFKASGHTRKEFTDHMAQFHGISRRDAYRAWLSWQEGL